VTTLFSISKYLWERCYGNGVPTRSRPTTPLGSTPSAICFSVNPGKRFYTYMHRTIGLTGYIGPLTLTLVRLYVSR